MKKCFCFAIVMLIFTFPACTVDFYVGQRPVSDPNIKWVSKNPDIYFVITNDLGAVGELEINSQVIPVRINMDHGTGIIIFDRSTEKNTEEGFVYGKAMLSGNCKFYKNKIVVSVENVTELVLFDADIKEITFIRQNINE